MTDIKQKSHKQIHTLKYQYLLLLKGGRQDLCRQTRFELEGSGKTSLKKWHKQRSEGWAWITLKNSGEKCIPVEKTALFEGFGTGKDLEDID